MKSRNKIFLAGAIGLVLAASGVAAHAQTGTSSGPMSNLVNAIAQKFNLNPSDVQKVVDEQLSLERTAREAKQEQNFKDRVNAAVTSGNLTQDQANKILAEHAALKSQMDALRNQTLTPQERQAQIKSLMKAAKQWAKDNKISESYIFPELGKRVHKKGVWKNGVSNHMSRTASTSSN